ncbi:acyltransferase [Halomicrobium salinisoli]|uniref:acyltransferase n=1 Tax=Halomicrobium salinisoli TaxID=2878391 RepID=UPI001CEFB544|nr:acyltransferase [Halomicrobium salinisoli]
MTKRHVSLPPLAEEGLRAFIAEVDERLSGDEDTCDVVEDVLVDLHGDREAYERWQSGGDVTPAERVRLQGYDPCNTTLESEYYAEKDEEAFERSKHLQWLWRQFDATPMADNIEFALRFRRMLADHLFEDCGDDCRFFKGITFTYGHNITVGDNVVVHDDVHLDDRGKLTIGDRVSISDDAHVYSHDHDVVDQTEVDLYHTIVEDDVRVTYDSMVRAGVRLGENSVLAAKSIAQRDVPAHHVAAGQPAKSITVKPGWEPVAESTADANVDRREQRRIEYDLPEDLEQFDEFGRDRSPPDA